MQALGPRFGNQFTPQQAPASPQPPALPQFPPSSPVPAISPTPSAVPQFGGAGKIAGLTAGLAAAIGLILWNDADSRADYDLKQEAKDFVARCDVQPTRDALVSCYQEGVDDANAFIDRAAEAGLQSLNEPSEK